MTVKKIVLVRHGETDFTKQHLFCGAADPDLTEKGRADAKSLLKHPTLNDLDVLLCSPSKRAQQTSEAITQSTNMPVNISEGFMETNFGIWEGVRYVDVHHTEEHRLWTKNPALWAPPEGEAGINVQNRAVTALVPYLKKFDNIALVSHKGTIRLLYSFFVGLPANKYRDLADVAPASITAIWLYDGEAVQTLLGDTSHLSSEKATSSMSSLPENTKKMKSTPLVKTG